MWDIIKRRNNATMYRRIESDYSIWIIEYPTEYEVVINHLDPSVDIFEMMFNRAGYKSFEEAETAARQALHELRYGA